MDDTYNCFNTSCWAFAVVCLRGDVLGCESEMNSSQVLLMRHEGKPLKRVDDKVSAAPRHLPWSVMQP